ncbi:endonuclease/exonuclease/phosphatase family protein [Actinoplanes sp. NEAU-A12]|uniref:Endonuclease/exonuclease/phosphatase family protein n=1 Tax=Actinoplanes sandaracinus TaxID=3045177 RepID=A0ABT6WSV2_9ACTN|nr:LamG-like jellyroll fold domain-containing protein [Actinoplanes sandaracinus]MDI6102820.1 endonuclease/exonuclease/phosphatase family protein [Actinoplanes sandaracinus]
MIKLVGVQLAPTPVDSAGAAVDPAGVAYQFESVRAMSWNVCNEAGGMRGSDAFCAWRNQQQGKAEAIASIAHTRDLNALLLQEICYSENERQTNNLLTMVMRLLGPGWTYTTQTGRHSTGSGCRDGIDGVIGNAIVVRGKITSSWGVDLQPVPDPRVKRMHCAKVEGWGTTLCNAHLLHSSAQQYQEQTAILVEKLAAVGPVLLGGDFNHSYRAGNMLQPLYDGPYAECDGQAYVPGDSVNEVTHNNVPENNTPQPPTKLDYMFSTAGFASCDVLTEWADSLNLSASAEDPNGYSDHAPVIGYTRGQAITWRFSEKSGATVGDASGNGYSGTVAGDATWSSARGGSMSFRGNGRVAGVKARGVLLPTRRSFTVSAWARVAAGAPNGTVLSVPGEAIYGLQLGYSRSDNSWQFAMPANDAPGGAGNPIDRVAAPAKPGVWTHLVVTFDAVAGKIGLYVDGKLAATASHTSRWTADQEFSVGSATNAGAVAAFTGEIDDVHAYAYPLRPVEIANLNAAETIRPQTPAGNTTIPAAADPADPGCHSNGGYGTTPTLTPQLAVRVAHADPTVPVWGEFSLWDNSNSNKNVFYLGDAAGVSDRITGSGTVAVTVPTLIPGHLYGWYARSTDGRSVSETTAVCHFRVPAQ